MISYMIIKIYHVFDLSTPNLYGFPYMGKKALTNLSTGIIM